MTGERASWAAVVAGVAAQVAWFGLDDRVTADPGRWLFDVPRLYTQWTTLRGVQHLAAIASTSGGWYRVFVALWLDVAGRSAAALDAEMLLWFAVALVSVRGIARALAGERAAVAAVALSAGLPGFVQLARSPCVHVPETALLLAAAAGLAADPSLLRRRSIAWVAVSGALALLIRPSALVWGACLLPPLLAARPRAWPVALLWAPALVVSAIQLPTYVSGKEDHGDAGLTWAAANVFESLGIAGAVVVGLGGVLAVTATERRWITGTLLAWAVGPAVLMLRYRSGEGDFLLLGPALACLVAPGLARFRGSTVAAFAPFVATVGALVLPQARVVWGGPRGGPVLSLAVPFRAYGGHEVDRLLAVTCPRSGDCHVLAPLGIYLPDPDKAGTLQLFLARHDAVELRGLGDLPGEGWRAWRTDALVAWDCPGDRQTLGRTTPGLARETVDAARIAGVTPWVEISVDVDCSVVWLAPRGATTSPAWASIVAWAAEEKEPSRSFPSLLTPVARQRGPAPR